MCSDEEFLQAVIDGDLQRVSQYLHTSTSPANRTIPITKDGEKNALHICSETGNSDIASILIQSGNYDVDTFNEAGFTPLQIAAALGHLDMVKLLLKSGADPNLSDCTHGNTALHEASWKGFSKTVSAILSSKYRIVNSDARNKSAFTPLHLACQNGHNQSCRELLLNSDCDINACNNYGDTPLHTGARYGHAGVIRILISAFCNVSQTNKNGDTALHIAAAMNRRKLTKILVEAGCDKTVINKQNETAEDIARRKCLTQILDILVKNEHDTNKTLQCISSKPHLSQVKTGKKKIIEKSNVDRMSELLKTKMVIPWSPYGCHSAVDCLDFPQKPNLDTLPKEPLKKGEQYYLDLAGNIRKGPMGTSYACYCAPVFKELERQVSRKSRRLKKRIEQVEENIDRRLQIVERRLMMDRENREARCREWVAAAVTTTDMQKGLQTSTDDPLGKNADYDEDGIEMLRNCSIKEDTKWSEADNDLDAVATHYSVVSSSQLDSGNQPVFGCGCDDHDEQHQEGCCNDSGYSTKIIGRRHTPLEFISSQKVDSPSSLSSAVIEGSKYQCAEDIKIQETQRSYISSSV